MEHGFTTMQELLASLSDLGDRQCLLWFEEEGSDSMSYAAFTAMALDIARGLTASGIGPGQRVGLFAENRWQTVVLTAGVVLSGAAVAALDPQLSGEVLRHVLTDADPAMLLATGPQEQAMRDAMGQVTLPVLLTDQDQGERSWRSLLAMGKEKGLEPGRVKPDDTVALFYTSGTTGMPKGVPLSHTNVIFQGQALHEAGLTRPGDRILLPLPLHHVYPFVVGMFGPLSLGVCLIIPRAITGAEVIRAAREGRASIVIGIPRLYEALVAGVMGRLRSLRLPARLLMLGFLEVSRFVRKRLGLRLGRVLLRGLHKRMGPELRIMASGGAPLEPGLAWTMEALGWKVAIGYGLTETSPILSINPPGAGRFESVGQALPGVDMRIAPLDGGQGEIQARGPNVFAGYRNLPDKTAEAFTQDGWFRTGDLGHLEDGWLVISGRASTMIVTRGGENVQPDAVEQMLDRHPLLRETGVLEREGKVAVLAVPDIVASRQAGLEPEDAARGAVAEAARQLPSYQRPALVAVSVNPLERTRLGKIRRHKLERHFDRALQGGAEQDTRPLDPREMQTADRRLLENPAAAATWELLAKRYPRRRLTPDADLAADLGVDSLEWLDLSLELGERTGVNLDQEQIASIATVRDLLRAVLAPQDRGKATASSDPVTAPEEYLDDGEKRQLEPAAGWRLGFYRAMHLVFGSLARLVFRMEVRGLEHLERQGPLVLTPNHLSFVDGPLLAAALPFASLRHMHFLAWQGAAFGNPVLAFISRTGQAISIDPAKRPGTSLALPAAVLGRGRDLVLFPEGMRSKDGALQRFQPGLGRILADRDALVIPVLLQGTRDVLPPGRWWLAPAKVRVTLGEPVPASELRQGEACDSPADCVIRNLRQRMENMAQTTAD
jgi:long-chain acyl-CoA synthetase